MARRKKKKKKGEFKKMLIVGAGFATGVTIVSMVATAAVMGARALSDNMGAKKSLPNGQPNGQMPGGGF